MTDKMFASEEKTILDGGLSHLWMSMRGGCAYILRLFWMSQWRFILKPFARDPRTITRTNGRRSTNRPWDKSWSGKGTCQFLGVCLLLGWAAPWSVRPAPRRTARVIFCIVQGQMILLHGFIKKTQQTPKRDLDIARERQAETE
jgi:hypothetical protein